MNAQCDEHLLEEDVIVNANNSKVEIGFEGGLTKQYSVCIHLS